MSHGINERSHNQEEFVVKRCQARMRGRQRAEARMVKWIKFNYPSTQWPNIDFRYRMKRIVQNYAHPDNEEISFIWKFFCKYIRRILHGNWIHALAYTKEIGHVSKAKMMKSRIFQLFYNFISFLIHAITIFAFKSLYCAH